MKTTLEMILATLKWVKRNFLKYVWTSFTMALLSTTLFYYQFWKVEVPTGEIMKVIQNDTMYVEVINLPNIENTFRKEDNEVKPDETPSKRLESDTGTTVVSTRLELVATLPVEITEVTQLTIVERKYEPTISILWQYIMYPILALLLGLGVWRYFKEASSTREAPVNLEDPPELFALFEQHATIIKDLGTPRKIKRFCNRIRFQYNMLSKDSTLTYDLLMYFSIMLLIESEKMKTLFLLPYEKFELAVYDLHDKASREAYPHLSKDQIIDSLVLPKLYKLNRNVLV